MFVIIIFFALFFLLGFEISISFLLGALLSALSGWIGMNVATLANVRTTNAARKDVGGALRIAFSSGVVMGLSVLTLGLLGLFALAWSLNVFDNPGFVYYLFGFSFGASLVALFARVGGGIYTKAADISVDLVGKLESKIPEEDSRNPAVIADNVGDNVGDVAGRG